MLDLPFFFYNSMMTEMYHQGCSEAEAAEVDLVLEDLAAAALDQAIGDPEAVVVVASEGAIVVGVDLAVHKRAGVVVIDVS